MSRTLARIPIVTGLSSQFSLAAAYWCYREIFTPLSVLKVAIAGNVS
jgi:hypothetical protein